MFKSKNIFLMVILGLCLSFGAVQAEFGKSLRYVRSPTGEDLICVYKFGFVQYCYPRVFQATAEYQTILEGQEIPKGLDIQISMRTGERRAKLSDETIRQLQAQQYQQQQYEQQQYQQPQYQQPQYQPQYQQPQYQQQPPPQQYQQQPQQYQQPPQQQYQQPPQQYQQPPQQQYQQPPQQQYQQQQEDLRFQQLEKQAEHLQQEQIQAQQQPHDIVMVESENNEEVEKDKTEQKVQIHTGKYKSSESPYVEGPDSESSSDSDDDGDNDNVVKIHYQDTVSYTEAFGSLSKAKTLEEKIEVLEQIEDIVHHIEFGQELMKSLPEFLVYLKDENPKIRALAAICIGSSLQNNPKARKTAIKQNLYEVLIGRLTNEEDINVLKRLCYAFSNLVRSDSKMIKKLHKSRHLGLLYQLYINKPALRSKLETFITDVYDPEKMKEGTKLEEFVDKESAQLWCSVFQNNIIYNKGYIPDTLNSLNIMLEAGQCSSIAPSLRNVLLNLPYTQPELFEETHDLNNSIQKVLNYRGPQGRPYKEL